MSDNFRNFTELDFETIKDSFKTYLKNQEEFKDYNFEGSALNTLMNVMSYSTMYNAFYLNMHSSERFLSTAQRRENVIAIARNLGYTARPSKGAVALLTMELVPVFGFNFNTIEIPKETTFTTKIDDVSLTFYTKNAIVVSRNAENKFIAENVEVFQGKKFNYIYKFKEGDTGFIVPNKGVDIENVRVFVKNSEFDTGIEFSFAGRTEQNMIVSTTSTSNIYFIEEVEGEKYRIFFGDNVVGVRPSAGQFIEVIYFTNLGNGGNGAVSFSLSSSIENVDNAIVQPSISSGGDDIENIESIRINAPWFFEKQNRAVTSKDYISAVREIFPQAYSISSFGGEILDPPILGYVFLSVIKKDNFGNPSIDFLSDSEKTFIENQLREKASVISILPEVIDPTFTFIEISSKVNFDSRILNPGTQQLRTLAIESLFDFSRINFSTFLSSFRLSKVIANIDSIDQSVVSNETEVSVYSEYTILEEFKENGFIDIGIPVIRGTVKSSLFYYDLNGTGNYENNSDYYLVDNPPVGSSNIGTLDLYRIEGSVPVLKKSGVATIDYNTGKATFSTNLSVWDFDKFLFAVNFNVNPFFDLPFKLKATPFFKDIEFKLNRLPVLRKEDINVIVSDINSLVG